MYISREAEKRTQELSSRGREDRLSALRKLKAEADAGAVVLPQPGPDVNNHIHTVYSFSPYTPAMAVWKAKEAGLSTAGIIDHDSVSGVEEFRLAGAIMDMPVTTGLEIRSGHSDTRIGERRTNNPDQGGISYLTLHGVPAGALEAVRAFLAPINEARGARNRRMCARIGEVSGVGLDYDADVVSLSMAHEGGSVTERHLLFALANRLIDDFGKGRALGSRIDGFMELGAADEKLIMDEDDPWYDYHLLGVLKARFVDSFYLPASDAECPAIEEVAAFAEENDIILTYPYLGDVGQSVTMDKRPQTFEDGYLDVLFDELAALGFRAVSYMPSRNTPGQIARIREFCERYDMLQITGEDINTPFQPFICTAQRDPSFMNLHDSAWALIGHEIATEREPSDSFLRLNLPLNEKVRHFKNIAFEACKGNQDR